MRCHYCGYRDEDHSSLYPMETKDSPAMKRWERGYFIGRHDREPPAEADKVCVMGWQQGAADFARANLNDPPFRE